MSPKVLVISNTSLNTSNSNGRTLGLLLSGIQKENLMQFCIKDEAISSELIREAYCVSDSMILKGIFSNKITSKKLPASDVGGAPVSQPQKGKKTALKFLMRETAWSLKLGCTDFLQRALDFKPDVILFQLATSGFLADLAYKLSKKCNAKLIVFTTEDYYFKTWDFIQPDKKSGAFAVYMAKYRKAIDRLFQNTSVCIANTPDLAEQYADKFGVQTRVIMAAASESIAAHFKKQENTIVYAGNLTLNRHQSIIDIAKIVSHIDPHAMIAVYGRTTPEIERDFSEHQNISIKGFVKYEQLLPQLANARLLLHCESFDEFYRKDLRSAFSTKIADSLASGVPLLLFAPNDFSETKYLAEEQCAFVCTDSEELECCVEKALFSDAIRLEVLGRAKQVANQNHNLKRNQEKIYDIIVSVCNGCWYLQKGLI